MEHKSMKKAKPKKFISVADHFRKNMVAKEIAESPIVSPRVRAMASCIHRGWPLSTLHLQNEKIMKRIRARLPKDVKDPATMFPKPHPTRAPRSSKPTFEPKLPRDVKPGLDFPRPHRAMIRTGQN